MTRKHADSEPWKYIGYHGFSMWVASDNDFFVLRQFGTLNARIILMKQDRIAELEQRLEMEDRASLLDPQADNGSFRNESRPERWRILQDLEKQLKDYNEFVLSYSELKNRPRASGHAVNNVKNWFYNNEEAIAEPERQFVDTDSDLVSLVPKIRTPLRRFLELFDWFRLSCCFRVKSKDFVHYSKWYESQSTKYHNDTTMDAVVTCVVTILGLGMLIGPMWWLEYLADPNKRLGVITGCVTLFTVLLSTVTVAKPFEVVAATAAYTAVLMVYMQMSSNGGNTG
ncbi:MAG: hypothetical protein M1827_000124 [Pycnora praestabilis]|nr:MAG: hypothetical protein M1827_000124 [Pycnora praestabilis]